MSGTVVFLGAGASVPLGLPVTAGIFPLLLQRLLNKEAGDESLFGEDCVARRQLKSCLHTLFPGLTEFIRKSQDQRVWQEKLLPITDVLSTIDYLLLSSNSPTPRLTLAELARARLLLERGIFELLVRTESPDALGMEGIPDAVLKEWRRTSELPLLQRRPPDHQDEIRRAVDWLIGLERDLKRRVTLISTNYDIEFEQELYTRLGYEAVFRQVDFGTRVREPDKGTVYGRPAEPRFSVYKLHGSLNWLRCSVCDNVYVNPAGAIAYLSFLLGEGEESLEDPWLKELEDAGANQCHCGSRPLKHVIVAPSLVRDMRDPVLNEIWRSAFEALRQADEWIIVGYSLPPEDVAIRSLVLRAFHGRDGAKPRIVAVQGEKKEPEITRFQLLFGDYDYVEGGLAGYLARKG